MLRTLVRTLLLRSALLSLLPGIAGASDFDFFASNRQIIRNGVQAVLMCNGLFTSERTLEQVFEQELAYLPDPVGTVEGGDYRIDRSSRAVTVGGNDQGPAVAAIFREGLACVVLPPETAPAQVGELPQLSLPAPPEAFEDRLWPDGDRVVIELPPEVDGEALAAASDWAFERSTPEQDTLSLLVVYRGQIVHERYAPGIDRDTRTRTWSTAKSLAATLIGMLVDAGQLDLDAPLGIDWLPQQIASAKDPRRHITLRHLLHMSSGLYPVDSEGMEYATGSGRAYWAGASSVDGARRRGLVREPGSYWDYENYDTLLAVYAMKRALGGGRAYLEYPHQALFQPLGMYDTLASTDRFGDFIFSSQVYTTARDLARFGLLYLNRGLWQGQRLLSETWIDFVRSPAPASAVRGNDYGGHWWLVPDDRKDEVPGDAYSTAGNRGQFVIVAPSHELVIVRRGLDYGRQGFDRWDLLQEIIKAFPAAD
jgi:CubicO group peptidase (beta-lactamase class C family)